MWSYAVKTGELLDPTGKFEGTGYSGLEGIWRNNPDTEQVPDKGPIPRGVYTIGPALHDPKLGPMAMHLVPSASTEEFDRSDFYIHGDNVNHDASHGCIILGPMIRAAIAASGDRLLNVV